MGPYILSGIVQEMVRIFCINPGFSLRLLDFLESSDESDEEDEEDKEDETKE